MRYESELIDCIQLWNTHYNNTERGPITTLYLSQYEWAATHPHKCIHLPRGEVTLNHHSKEVTLSLDALVELINEVRCKWA